MDRSTFSAPAPEAADNEAMNVTGHDDQPDDRFVRTTGDCSTAVAHARSSTTRATCSWSVAWRPIWLTFEAALTVGDTVGRRLSTLTVADQSTFNITDDTDPALTVTSPGGGNLTTASTFTITGTGIAGYMVAIYNDADNGGDIDCRRSQAGRSNGCG